ncbi:hypothetical protein RB600_005167 [Gaeumannomyces tritici]
MSSQGRGATATDGIKNHDFPKPKFVTGGCLCGALRYRADFPPTHDFGQSSSTCQCTQCRRNTSSLLFVCHEVSPSDFRLGGADGQSAPPADALREYRASGSATRAFCGRCGSLLYWKPDTSDRVSVAVGTVDPLFLWGEGAPGSAEAREHAVPAGGYARALVGAPGRHFWCANEIAGVTDGASMKIMAGGKRAMGDE